MSIPKPKKGGADNRKDFRTLGLTNQASKILCRIIESGIEEVSEKVLGEDQIGFRNDEGTRAPILTLMINHS